MRYLEDLAVGERFTTPSIEVSEADILAFARQFDPQPMHADAELARSGPQGGLTASGWHTAALVIRLIVTADPLAGTPWLGLGVEEMRWPQPLRPGDSISVEVLITALTPSRSKPGHGIVRVEITARNQRGEVVLKQSPALWIPRRPRPADEPG